MHAGGCRSYLPLFRLFLSFSRSLASFSLMTASFLSWNFCLLFSVFFARSLSLLSRNLPEVTGYAYQHTVRTRGKKCKWKRGEWKE